MTISIGNFGELPLALHQFTKEALLTFDYSREEWEAIRKAMEHLRVEPDAVLQSCERLRRAARSYFRDVVYGPGDKETTREREKHWANIDSFSRALLDNFYWIAQDEIDNGPPAPDGREIKPYCDEKLALMKINVMAKRHLATARIDDGYPKTTSKSSYRFKVLEVWIGLGGKLKISRHPITGKIKGPLSRYFSAVTRPVLAGSIESLPDIIKGHQMLKAALEKWRLEMAIANTDP